MRLNIMPFTIVGGWFDIGEMYWYRLRSFWYVFVTILLFSIAIVKSRKLISLDGSSNSHSRMPKLFTSFFNAIHSASVPVQMPIMSSMKRRNNRRLFT